MRRKKQALSASACAAVLKRGTAGVLAVLGDGGYPYAVPLSYAYDKSAQKLYFHCARTGHELDAIARHSQVSFCAVDKDQVMPQRSSTPPIFAAWWCLAGPGCCKMSAKSGPPSSCWRPDMRRTTSPAADRTRSPRQTALSIML